MPNGSHEPAVSYRYDRDTGQFVRQGADGDEAFVTLDQLSNGALESDGQRIYSTYNPFNNWPMRRTGDFTITALSGDRYVMQNGISMTEINSLAPVAALRGISGEFTHTLPNGVERTMKIDFMYTSKAGMSLFLRAPEDGPKEWLEIENGPLGAAARQAAIEAGYRLADWEDVVQRAIAAYALGRYQEELADMIATGERDETGMRITKESQAAGYLGRIYASEMEGFLGSVMYAPPIVSLQ